MKRPTDPMRRRREQAWAFGRDLRDSLLADYQRRYGVLTPPPPALIVDELLTDILEAKLHYDPLPEHVFAKTEWTNGKAVVTVNTLTGTMPGVKDAAGVQNVGKWHETVHVVNDSDVLRVERQATLPGFDEAQSITCYRSGTSRLTSGAIAREFWAEEAGRAAAVSFRALGQSNAFQQLTRLARRSSGPTSQAWPLLYQAASDIGVNITALVKQLGFEGWLVIETEAGRQQVYLQPTLADLLEAA